MDFETELNESLAAVRDARLDKKTDDELNSMIRVLRRWQNSQYAPQAPGAIAAIESEQKRRQKERRHEGEKTLHDQAISQAVKHHQETMNELNELKILTDRLAQARWIDWAIFAAGVIAALAAIASVVLDLFRSH